jgi:hypothetical protein
MVFLHVTQLSKSIVGAHVQQRVHQSQSSMMMMMMMMIFVTNPECGHQSVGFFVVIYSPS